MPPRKVLDDDIVLIRVRAADFTVLLVGEMTHTSTSSLAFFRLSGKRQFPANLTADRTNRSQIILTAQNLALQNDPPHRLVGGRPLRHCRSPELLPVLHYYLSYLFLNCATLGN